MSLATSLIALGIQPITATRLGFADRVPLDGNGTTQGTATLILPDNTNIAAGTQVGDTAFILFADAEFFQEYFILNTTAEPALIYPPVGDTIDNLAVNAPITIETDKSRIIWRVEEGRWVSVMTGLDQTQGVVETIVAGAGISVDSTDPANPIVSNTGVLSITAGTGITNTGTAANPILNAPDVGTVTSVGMSVPTGLTVAGSPITTSGTLAVTYTAGYQGFTTAEAALVASAVQTISVATANGLAGSSSGGTAPALTLSTTITGVLKGNGTAISAAVANTDYQSPVALTTTGTSGAATFNGTTLNIPQYAGATTAGLTVGTSTITSGTTTRVLYDNAGVLGEYVVSGSGNVAMTTSPVFTTPTLGVATSSSIEATSATPSGNGMFLPAASTLGWSIGGTEELRLTATALSPGADGGNSLGTTALGWQNLFANTGFVFNIEGGNWVATHTTGIMTVGTGDLRVTNNFTNATSVVTLAGAQTLTNKSIVYTQLTGLGTGVSTALGVNVGSAGAFVTFNGALGTPSSGNLSNCTSYPGVSDTLAGIIEAAVQSEMEAASSTTLAVTPGRQQYHPSSTKCWAQVTVSAGTPTLQTSYNITSITDDGPGQITFTIANDFSSANWAHTLSVVAPVANGVYIYQATAKAAGSLSGLAFDVVSGVVEDPTDWSFSGLGDL